jgi:CIC family chloride channel protein
MLGGLVGTAAHGWLPAATASPGAYALVGMGAVVAATSHAPISAILILFELTQRIDIIPPLMIACVLSTVTAGLLQRESIYTLRLKRRGIELPEREDPNPLKSLYVSDVIDRAPEVVTESAPFEVLVDLLVSSDHTEFFVVNARGELLGAISLSALRRAILDREPLASIVVAGDLVEAGLATATEEDDLDVVAQMFSSRGVQELAVVDVADARRLVGSVRERDVMHSYREEVLRRDLAGSLSSSVAVVRRVHEVELGDDLVLRDVAAPHSFTGKTLGELDLRARTGALILLVRRPAAGRSGSDLRVPLPGDRLEDGDVLVAAGTRDALARLEAL